MRGNETDIQVFDGEAESQRPGKYLQGLQNTGIFKILLSEQGENIDQAQGKPG